MSSIAIAVSRKDIREFARDRRMMFASALIVSLALVAVALAYRSVASYEEDRTAAELRDRSTWLNQGARNPHGAAHFSTWAFRPLTPMMLLEPGVSPFAGAAIWMEAHVQDFAAARSGEDRVGTLDLGNLSLAWITQVLAPLLISVFAAGLIARERERGTLRLMLASGIDSRDLLRVKARGLATLAALVFAPLLFVAVLALAFAPAALSADQCQRLALWMAAHAVYLTITVLIAAAVSALSRSVERAMLVLVGIWVLAVPLAPRLAAAFAEIIAPTPGAQAFWKKVRAEEKQHDVYEPTSSSAKELVARVLKQYRVSRVEDLPVSFAGIQLDEAERNGDVVFDRNYGNLYSTQDRQRWVMRGASIVSPLIAIQNISTGIAGSDAAHHRNFAKQAEAHRRATLTQLNGDMTLHAGKLDFDYNANPALWATIPSFSYAAPPWTLLMGVWAPDLVILFIWLGAGMASLNIAGRVLAQQEL